MGQFTKVTWQIINVSKVWDQSGTSISIYYFVLFVVCFSETDPERALWCQKLFRSGIGVLCMSGTVQQVASLRRRICRDLLLTIYGVLQRRNEVCGV